MWVVEEDDKEYKNDENQKRTASRGNKEYKEGEKKKRNTSRQKLREDKEIKMTSLEKQHLSLFTKLFYIYSHRGLLNYFNTPLKHQYEKYPDFFLYFLIFNIFINNLALSSHGYWL